MEYTVDEVLKYIEEEDAKFIRLAFRDAFGVQKNLSVMPGEIRKAFGLGIPVNARSIAGFEEGPHSLLYLKPDSSTLAVLPWRPDSGRVLRMFCELVTPEGEEAPADTRTLLRKAEAEAREEGVEFRFGAETEFYLFLKDENGNPTKTPYDRAGYMDIAPLDRCENIRREICLTAERMGLTPERSHHEQGPGQNEIDFHYAKPVKAADQMTTFRMVVSTMADRYGLHADFSPRPLPGEPRNGCRINIYAADRDGGDVSEYAAAGILRRLRKDQLVFSTPQCFSQSGPVMPSFLNKARELLQLFTADRSLHIGCFKIIAKMRIHILMIISCGEVAMQSVKTMSAEIVPAARADAVSSPVTI